MKFMPFNDDQQPFYSDESEKVIFRVKDIKTLIEDRLQFPIVELKSMGSQDNPDTLKELYPDLMPHRIWFVLATVQTPEGNKTAEIMVMLKDGQISLPRHIFLHLETFLLANREQAKQNVSDLTLDYIETLEEVVSDTWRFWRDFVYFLDRHYAQLFVQGTLKPQFSGDLARLYETFKKVNFLSSSEQAIDPFPGGVFDLVERSDEKRKREGQDNG